MRSTITDEQRFKENHDVPKTDQQQASLFLKMSGFKVQELPITIWKVDNEYLTPHCLVRRVKEGHYASKEKKNTNEGTEGTDLADIQPYQGRPSKNTQDRDRLRGDTDKRVEGQQGKRGDGRGTRKSVPRRDSELAYLARQEAKIIRKRAADIPAVEDNNDTRKTRVGKARKPGTDAKKPRVSRQHNGTRQKPLRGANKSRIRATAGMRKRRS